MLIFKATMATAAVEADIFPGAVQGWVLVPETEDYTPEDLYKYIDGASELYISYGFKTLSTRRYKRDGWPEITVDLFDMGGPGNAFGIFAHSQEKPGPEVGQDSEYLDGLLRFWQGGYYVSILCSPETPESQTAVMALGRQMARRLPPAGSRPGALALLPEQGLIASSIRYFCHSAWQNTYVFIAADDILGIGPGCEALLAKYDLDGQRPVVLLVLYPGPTAAGRAFGNLCRRFNLPAGAGETVRLEDRKYFAAALENGVVVAVWHGGSAAQALELLAALRANLPGFKR